MRIERERVRTFFSCIERFCYSNALDDDNSVDQKIFEAFVTPRFKMEAQEGEKIDVPRKRKAQGEPGDSETSQPAKKRTPRERQLPIRIPRKSVERKKIIDLDEVLPTKLHVEAKAPSEEKTPVETKEAIEKNEKAEKKPREFRRLTKPKE
ncbi:uncharacterized protein BXIN_0624 [Babesia sp. Xinjiang]|uniref:uncharacterized protein n=1 Tax=Babesia sp. Xinjiang TaxID=462227 RepID=UPI000A23051E|nr:uncharacterized protein BXIN_0624 [Babesia sp. Xinjiang]ORM41819.1 hypothetical protein BXIN_0624 [Babesia sp. Xinjiang]